MSATEVTQANRDVAENLKRQLRACSYGNDLYARALNRIEKLEKDCASYARTMAAIASNASESALRALAAQGSE